MVIVPFTSDATFGIKYSERAIFCRAGMVRGATKPISLNPVPLTRTLEIVTLVCPLFVSQIVCCWLLPIATPGKYIIGESVEIWVVADPVAIIVMSGWDALLSRVITPRNAPTVVGAK